MTIEELKALAHKALTDLKAEDILELDVTNKTSVTDFIIVATGTSTRHVKSIASNVVADAKHAGYQPLGVEGEKDGEWVLVDLGDVIVHVMQRQVREFYDIESLWRMDLTEHKSINS